MRHLLLLLLAAVATPVGLHGQDREYSEVPIMAAAVKYMQQFYGERLPGEPPTPQKYVRTTFRLASATYLIEPIETRLIDGRQLSRQRVPRKATPQDPLLLHQLAAAVSLDTVTVERAVRICAPFEVPSTIGRTATFTNCRFTQSDGVFGLSTSCTCRWAGRSYSPSRPTT